MIKHEAIANGRCSVLKNFTVAFTLRTYDTSSPSALYISVPMKRIADTNKSLD